MTALIGWALLGLAQSPALERLPPDQLDVTPPSAAVTGVPGRMRVRSARCRELPVNDTRRRIVDIAAQEWGFFGFSVVDQTQENYRRTPGDWRRWRQVDPEEGARVAASIAGYWAATPQGAWMVDRQNERWAAADGLRRRWRDPWSAAFVSWVMCEAGLGASAQFRRAIAHHVYVDQAIRGGDAAFVAHEVGAEVVEPGDLLCTSRRNAYPTLAARSRHIGVSARMHCDIVVQTEPQRGRILAIGGNVRGTVSMKMLPAAGERLAPTRATFAHLKLRAESIGPNALDDSPTMGALRCSSNVPVPSALRALAAIGDAAVPDC